MKFEVSHLSPAKKALLVELPAERVTRAFNRFSNEIARQVQLPGFRPGRAPLSLVRRHYQRDIYERVLRQLSLEAINEAVAAAQLQVVGEPVIQDVRLNEQLPFVLKLEVDVFPEFTVGPLEGLEGLKEITPVTDADVEQRLAQLQRATATVEEVRNGIPAQVGDVVQVELQGFALEDGATALREGQLPLIAGHLETVNIGGERTRPEFDAALRGKTVGDVAVVEIEYPADDTAPKVVLKGLPAVSLAGKRIQFHLVVKHIFRPSLPPLDDAWAHSYAGMDLAALRARIKSDLEADRERHALDKLHTQLLDQLIIRTGVEAPASLVAEQIKSHVQDWLSYLERQGSPPPTTEDLHKLSDIIRPRAETEVKQILVLEQVAREAGVQITEDELAGAIAQLASGLGQPPEVVRARLTRENQLDTLRLRLRSQKALDIIRSAARIETRVVSASDAPTSEETVSFLPENQ